MQTNMHEAKTKLSKLAEKALKGEKVVIAKSGVPIVELIPYRGGKPRVFGQFKGQFKVSDDFDSQKINDQIADTFEGDK
jgi:prevent-host-death family protein